MRLIDADEIIREVSKPCDGCRQYTYCQYCPVTNICNIINKADTYGIRKVNSKEENT